MQLDIKPFTEWKVWLALEKEDVLGCVGFIEKKENEADWLSSLEKGRPDDRVDKKIEREKTCLVKPQKGPTLDSPP